MLSLPTCRSFAQLFLAASKLARGHAHVDVLLDEILLVERIRDARVVLEILCAKAFLLHG